MKNGHGIPAGLITAAGVLVSLIASPPISAQGLMERKVLAVSARTKVVSEPPTQTTDLGALRLVRGNPKRGWRSLPGDSPPFVFVFELGAGSVIDRLVFINSGNEERRPGIGARDVEVELSVDGPLSGYTSAGKFVLEKGMMPQEFKIPSTRVRWVRFTILSNHGHIDQTEFGQIEAWGRFDFRLPVVLSVFISIVGVSLILASASRHEHLASTLNIARRIAMRRASFRRDAGWGALLMAAGAAAAAAGPGIRIALLAAYGVAGAVQAVLSGREVLSRKRTPL